MTNTNEDRQMTRTEVAAIVIILAVLYGAWF